MSPAFGILFSFVVAAGWLAFELVSLPVRILLGNAAYNALDSLLP